jgi:L-asparaginase / beta-aspartyl-peptidase
MARFIVVVIFFYLVWPESLKDHYRVPKRESRSIALVIHGGAGTIRNENLTPEREKGYHEALKQALHTGTQYLPAAARVLKLSLLTSIV